MKKNVGKTDKIIRVLLGLAVGIFGILSFSWLGLIGLGIILPALMGNDPLYSLLGVSTNKA